WMGPNAGEHDFSLERHDIEVKTTTQERRIHTVQSSTQLEPSPGRLLFLLSLQITAGGLAGTTLAEAVAQVRRSIPAPLEEELVEKLASCGWQSEHDTFYETRFLFRTSPILITIDGSFPRISADRLALLDPDVRTRISNLSYDVNVDGLGSEEGSTEFL